MICVFIKWSYGKGVVVFLVGVGIDVAPILPDRQPLAHGDTILVVDPERINKTKIG